MTEKTLANLTPVSAGNQLATKHAAYSLVQLGPRSLYMRTLTGGGTPDSRSGARDSLTATSPNQRRPEGCTTARRHVRLPAFATVPDGDSTGRGQPTGASTNRQ